MISIIILIIWWFIGSLVIILADAKLQGWKFFHEIQKKDIPLMILLILGSWISIVIIMFNKQ
jgi:hypothetical protein